MTAIRSSPVPVNACFLNESRPRFDTYAPGKVTKLSLLPIRETIASHDNGLTLDKSRAT
jgi:hypothetical protein